MSRDCYSSMSVSVAADSPHACAEQWAECPQTSKVFELSYPVYGKGHMDMTMKNLLRTMADILLSRPGRTANAAEVGVFLPAELMEWLRAQGLRICTVLRYYPHDFKIHKSGRGRKVECLRPCAEGFYIFSAHGLLCL
eukprot:TRINITY_DN13076_c0_g1_i2.p1 TRINITY_DN13076_c0_g1~~TRINITY_DN13076_c0_g1_i2.p1  ORF type:complete len:138 (-),score=23.91 TRINITY_DN13076_c0_g1_i2:403-816(-)